MFGKWHLGDMRPYRPHDRGFEEAVWFPSSQIGSVPDAWENDYFDDTYFRNDRREQFRGYTTDVLFDEAMRWIQRVAGEGAPWFCYLATAAAHEPHCVPAAYRERMAKRLASAQAQLGGFNPEAWYNARYGWKLGTELACYLGMIENIDDNWGRMDEYLRRLGLRDHTLVIFLTDNGSTLGPRYFNAGMRGGKATLWEGGHRVPCLIRWPAGRLRPAGDVTGLAVVQDLLPTLVDLLQLPRPEHVQWDGISLVAVVRGMAEIPPDRVVVINFSHMAPNQMDSLPDAPSVPRMDGGVVLWKRWRWVADRELYHLDTDPLQATNVASRFPQIAAMLHAHLEQWWTARRQWALRFDHVPLPRVGEDDLLLTSCEWADVFLDQQRQVRLGDRKNGIWHIEVPGPGWYRFRLRRYPPDSGLRLHDPVPERTTPDGVHTWPAGIAWDVAAVRIAIGTTTNERPVQRDAEFAEFILNLPPGRTTLKTAWLDPPRDVIAGAYYVEVRALGPQGGSDPPSGQGQAAGALP